MKNEGKFNRKIIPKIWLKIDINIYGIGKQINNANQFKKLTCSFHIRICSFGNQNAGKKFNSIENSQIATDIKLKSKSLEKRDILYKMHKIWGPKRRFWVFFWFIKIKSYFFCFCCVFRRNNWNGLADSLFVYFFSIFCCVPLLPTLLLPIKWSESHNV